MVTNETIKDTTKGEEKANKTANLNIWTDNKLRINLSNYQDCKMIIIGPDFSAITTIGYLRILENIISS